MHLLIFLFCFIRRYHQFIDLKTNLAHNDKDQVDVLERIIGYLRNTDKDSMVSFMLGFLVSFILGINRKGLYLRPSVCFWIFWIHYHLHYGI